MLAGCKRPAVRCCARAGAVRPAGIMSERCRLCCFLCTGRNCCTQQGAQTAVCWQLHVGSAPAARACQPVGCCWSLLDNQAAAEINLTTLKLLPPLQGSRAWSSATAARKGCTASPPTCREWLDGGWSMVTCALVACCRCCCKQLHPPTSGEPDCCTSRGWDTPAVGACVVNCFAAAS